MRLCEAPPPDHGGPDRPGAGVGMGPNGGVSGGDGLLADSANAGLPRHRPRRGFESQNNWIAT
jgi:hypothetical protein